jgi:ABC transporter substrate binding protein
VYRVAVLHLTSPPPPVVDAFRAAMRQLGWIEGQTLRIDYRGADDKGERFDLLAGEIVASRPDVIVTGTSGAAVAAKRATSTIPIAMAVSVDPVGLGVVASLARPGGNVTGQAILSPIGVSGRQDPQGRKTCRSAHRAAYQVRARHQPQDRQGPRPDDPAVAPAAGGSGDRVSRPRRPGPGRQKPEPLKKGRRVPAGGARP